MTDNPWQTKKEKQFREKLHDASIKYFYASLQTFIE